VTLTEKGNHGFIDKTEKMIIPPQFTDSCDFVDGLSMVEVKRTKMGVINKSGTFVWGPVEEVDDGRPGLPCPI
jgi:WG containing repeat